MSDNYKKTHEYLRSLIDPYSGPANYPDNNMTTSHVKALTLTKNIKVAGSGEGALVYTPASLSRTCRLYTPDAVGNYVYTATIEPDQDLSENYTWGRIVSAGLRAQDATISTTNAVLNGTFNAIGYQERPSFLAADFSYDKLLSYKRSEVEVVGQVPASEGVQLLMHPGTDNPFKLFETNAARNIENVLEISLNAAQANYDPNSVTLLSASVLGGQIPQGISGKVKVMLNINSNVPIGPNPLGRSRLRVTCNRNDPVTWLPIAPEIYETNIYFDAGVNAITTFLDCNTIADVTKVELLNDVINQPVYPVAANADILLRIESTDFYEYGSRGPGSILAFQGLQPWVGAQIGSVISIGGVYNYEVVPDANLARQITTSSARHERPLDLAMVESMIASNTIKFVWSLSEYKSKMAQGFATRMADMDHVAQASGFTDTIKGIVKTLAPVAGPLLASLGQPMLGAAISGLANASGTYKSPTMAFAGGTVKQTSNGLLSSVPLRRAYCSTDAELKETVGKPTITLISTNEDAPNEAIAEQVNAFLESYKPTSDGVAVEKNAKEEAFKRGQVGQLARLCAANKFPAIVGDRVKTGIVIHIPTDAFPYNEYEVKDENGFIDRINVVANGTNLDPYALLAVAYAHACAGFPSGQFIISVEGAKDVSDMSLGLAALNSAMGRESYSFLSGSVSPSGAIFAPGDVLKKADAVNNMGVGLITPYDMDADSALVEAFEKAGKGNLISFPAENQYLDFTPYGYWPAVILAANITVVVASAQFSRYYTVKSGNAGRLGQEAPILSTDTVTSFYYDDNGVMKERDPYIAPTKKLANTASKKVGKDLIPQSELVELETWARANMEPVTLFWKLGEAYAGSKFGPEEVPNAIKHGDPTAVQGTRTLKANIRTWSGKPDEVSNPNGRIITHDRAVQILREADVDQLAKALNIREKGGRQFASLDDYIRARVEAKIIQHAAAGLAETVTQVKAGKFKYATGYTNLAKRKLGKATAQKQSVQQPPVTITSASSPQDEEDIFYDAREPDTIVVANSDDLLRGLDELGASEESPTIEEEEEGEIVEEKPLPKKNKGKEKKKEWVPKEKANPPPPQTAGIDQGTQAILAALGGINARLDKQEAELRKVKVGGAGTRSRPS